MINNKIISVLIISSLLSVNVLAQHKQAGKSITPNLFGIFFEDINYAADGGIYAELIQNRSFEYSPTDRKEWHSLRFWEYFAWGYSYGEISVETDDPLHPNNPHYVVLHAEEGGREGIGLKNYGFDGIVLKKGDAYNFSIFIKQLSYSPVHLTVSIRNKKGDAVHGEAKISTNSREWKKYTARITADQTDMEGSLVILIDGTGKIALDMVSLFPEKTFKGRSNGMRADLAQAVADLSPKFMRFPGGCLVHGDGLGNMYRWKNTVGPVEERVAQKNIWGYHQTAGLGFFEYFQYCEDIGSEPVPVLPAAVSCQNSGGTWRIGGTGQKCIPLEDMDDYVQEVLDLVEYANGPVSSTWGRKRAAAGHPEPFNLKYVGIGNEDNTDFYDSYDRSAAKVYLGEYAAHEPDRKNTLRSALAEAAYMTGLERNGDIVSMASYAPMLAKKGHTQWNPDLIYFTNTEILKTANYYVQQLFMKNSGDNTAGFSSQSKVGTLPVETCETINNSWGFNLQDNRSKSLKELIQYLVKAAGYNANFLLNVGPMPNGKIQPDHVALLNQMGDWLKVNGATIYETEGGPIAARDWGVTTQKGNKVYVHILNWSDESLVLPAWGKKIRSAKLFSDQSPVKFLENEYGITIKIPEDKFDEVDTIVELELK